LGLLKNTTVDDLRRTHFHKSLWIGTPGTKKSNEKGFYHTKDRLIRHFS
jgi:hypothetical protein